MGWPASAAKGSDRSAYSRKMASACFVVRMLPSHRDIAIPRRSAKTFLNGIDFAANSLRFHRSRRLSGLVHQRKNLILYNANHRLNPLCFYIVWTVCRHAGMACRHRIQYQEIKPVHIRKGTETRPDRINKLHSQPPDRQLQPGGHIGYRDGAGWVQIVAAQDGMQWILEPVAYFRDDKRQSIQRLGTDGVGTAKIESVTHFGRDQAIGPVCCEQERFRCGEQLYNFQLML